jgi:GDP/UDP-N,N'-diacetylbacillosamine 2-epimerase (hydrolysing)
MKLGVLTSSRADYGIYLPLLNKLKVDRFFNLEIIAFGTHLSKNHGFTISEIEQDEYPAIHKIASLVSNDDEESIATSYGITVLKFAAFWHTNIYDLVLCLGDRFEMSAAVQAGIPYGVKFAHIHGGETTLGSIDNIYRDQITHASILHFTATDLFRERVSILTNSSANVHSVGSLSLDGISKFKPIDRRIFYNNFNIPNEDFALVTFHPETISSNANKSFGVEMRAALGLLASKLFLVVTMPNADTMGSIFREEMEKLKNDFPDRVLCIENFGKENYFSAMNYAKLLIGNTSSGILEAASFGKFVVNVGKRQKGRARNTNVIDVDFNKDEIINAVETVLNADYKGENIYYKANTSELVIKVIKEFYETL